MNEERPTIQKHLMNSRRDRACEGSERPGELGPGGVGEKTHRAAGSLDPTAESLLKTGSHLKGNGESLKV